MKRLASARKKLSALREFVWPLLEPLPEGALGPSLTREEVLDKASSLDAEGLVMLVEEAVRAEESEEQRLRTIESKAATMVGFNVVVMALMINAVAWLLGEPDIDATVGKWGALLILITILYFSRSIWFLFLVYTRAGYHGVTAEKLLKEDMSTDEAFARAIAALRMSSVVANYDVINNKVNWMVMGHEYLMRGMVCLTILAVWLVGGYLFPWPWCYLGCFFK